MNDTTQTGTIPGFTSNTAIINGVRLHYLLGGNPSGTPLLLWHGFLGTSYSWHKVAPLLADAGYSVLVPDMRGYGDSDKPAGNEGYDGRALAEEFRSLVRQTSFGAGRPLTLVAHDMGAPPALIWAADHPEGVTGLLYIEAPVMLQPVLEKILTYTPEAMAKGSMWWWILPLAPGVPESLLVGKEREFLNWVRLLRPRRMPGGSAGTNRPADRFRKKEVSHLDRGVQKSGSGKPARFPVRLTELEGLSICQHAARFACWISIGKRRRTH